MYQVLFYSETKGRFAANISKEEYEFLDDVALPCPDLYDTKISAKSYNGYGDFKTRNELMHWLHQVWSPNKKFEDFMAQYNEDFDNYKKSMRISRICSGILYYEYNTGYSTDKCWRRIGGMVHRFLEQYNAEPTKPNLRKFIRFAMRDYVLN